MLKRLLKIATSGLLLLIVGYFLQKSGTALSGSMVDRAYADIPPADGGPGCASDAGSTSDGSCDGSCGCSDSA
jgi:hypothetical protein